MLPVLIVIFALLSVLLITHVIWKYVRNRELPSTSDAIELVGVCIALVALLLAQAPNGATSAAGSTQTPPAPLPTVALGFGGPIDMSTPGLTTEPTTDAIITTGLEDGSTRVSPQDSMLQVYVAAGNFIMGSARSDTVADDDERPQREVYLDAFWIDQTEVTNAQYALFLNAFGGHIGRCDGQDCIQTYDENADSHILRQGTEYGVEFGFADYPVVLVSWHGANAYCIWAGRKLPTEAQWEKAARGVDGRIYPWGNTDSTCDLANFRSWRFFNSCNDSIAPVGSYDAGSSPYGVLDMAGNVWEWTADWYDTDYYPNSQEPTSSQYKALRGGAWNSTQDVRAANRYHFAPTDYSIAIGFRCVLE